MIKRLKEISNLQGCNIILNVGTSNIRTTWKPQQIVLTDQTLECYKNLQMISEYWQPMHG